MHDLLRRALAAHLVDGLEAPPNYSLDVGDGSPADGAAAQRFHFLYRSTSSVVRTRDPARLVHALFAYLDAHLPVSDPTELRLVGTALVGADGAVLAPPALLSSLEIVERRLNVCGLHLVDGPWAHLDPTSRELVVGEPRLDIDWGALDDLPDVAAIPRRRDHVVPAGRYPLRAWGFLVQEELAGPLPPAQALLRAAGSLVAPTDFGAQRSLQLLTDVVGAARFTGIPWTKAEDLVSPLCELGAGRGN